MADSEQSVRHPLFPPSSISFPSHLWEAPPLLAVPANLTPRLLDHALNALHACGGARVVRQVSGACSAALRQTAALNMTELVVRTLPSPSAAQGPGPDAYKGWLFKWTNYLKGYQRRWFVLSNGLLSYYRTQAEMAHTCRGTITLATVHIEMGDTCHFVLTSGGRSYHLKAYSEGECQRWVSALQQAKANATQMMPHSDDSGDEGPLAQPDRALIQGALKTLASKLEDLNTCNELIGKHGAALQRSLSELEDLRAASDGVDKLKTVNERATLFRITSNAMINVSFNGAEGTPEGESSEENEDIEFFDAMEDSPAFITVPADDHSQHSRGSLSSNWSQDDNVSLGFSFSLCLQDGSGCYLRRGRRRRIPDKPNYSLNLWSIMKNCIGKELSKIPMPVNFNEPLSMLQRLTEDLEYSELLDRAAHCDSSLEQMCLVAAFSVSSYSTTVHRTGKPFNPLLGETYELDRVEEYGYRSICEQISHHPPAAAHHVISQRGWTLWQEITIDSKFRGKYISIMPLGNIHLKFHASGNHYVWSKVTSTVHNIIVGKLWIDQSGDIIIMNHRNKDKCHLKFSPYSYFSRDVPRKVTGVVMDSEGCAHYILSGTWDDKMESAKIIESSHGSGGSEGKQKTVYQTLPPKLLWKKYPLPENAENMHYFSSLALTLNEPEDGVAPTDSRLRPDQRLMEAGLWDEANTEKQILEERQRLERRKREAQANLALEEGKEAESYQPLWFDKRTDTESGESSYVYKGGYWEAKDRQDWSQCPAIF
uniref:Oxysterol-binding protein n=1 Tax=Cyprinus carpio TaxID=7962 RepID=A0A8C1JPR8_CYPCA